MTNSSYLNFTNIIVCLWFSDTKKDFEDRVQRMLYGLPNQSVTLDRFVCEYEKHSGKKLSSFYGHPKLLKLLEAVPDTVTVSLTRVTA